MEAVVVLIVGFVCGFILGVAFMRSVAKYENKNKKKEKCPICEHETFINEYGDIQCSNCKKILPFEYYELECKTDKGSYDYFDYEL